MMASLLDLSKPHLAYYSVPAAWLIAFATGTFKFITAGKAGETEMPRRIVAKVKSDQSIDKRTAERVERADAAALNAYETLGFYAGGMAAAASAGVPAETLNKLALAYVATRAAYSFVYVSLQENAKWAQVRSLLWTSGISVIITLWVKAGNLAAAKAA